jgi:8-oxo-dGTP diphosphatase
VKGPLTLPFDHEAIVQKAVERLRNKSQYSSLPCFLAGDTFTLPQLQRIYEVLMDEPLNKVSFRRKVGEMDMLEPVEGQFEAAGAHRPAQLYRLKAAFRQRLIMLERGL